MKHLKIKKIPFNDVKKHPAYHEAIQQIKRANEELSDNSKAFKAIMDDQPEMLVTRPLDDKVFHLNKHWLGMLFLDVRIGQESYRFLMDTGAQVSCIGQHLKQHPHIKEINARIPVGDAGGYKSDMALCSIEQLSFCDVTVSKPLVLVLNPDQLRLALFGMTVFQLDGILGWDILKHLDFEVDLNRNLFFLTNKENNLFNFPPSDFPLVLLTDEQDRLLKFGLDIGARKSWVSEHLIETCQLKVIGQKTKTMYGVNGKITSPTKIISSIQLKLGGHALHFKHIHTGFTGLLNDFELDGVLGIDVLKKHKLIVYNHQGVMELGNYENRLR